MKEIDEKDMRYKSVGKENQSKESSSSKKLRKINIVEYNEANKFVVEALETKKQAKIMMKIDG